MVMQKKAQLKIQQMAFMIVAVLLFFVLAGIFFLNYHFKSLQGTFEDLQKQQAISSLKVISDMPEFSCSSDRSLCLDKDKLSIMATRSNSYRQLWPVASIKVIKVYPAFSRQIICPAVDCNTYNVYDSNQSNVEMVSTYVLLCEKDKTHQYIYDKCDIGKLLVGAKKLT